MTAAISDPTQQILATFDQFVIGNYVRYPVCLARGEGSRVWDVDGNEYLDFFPGWGCDLLGHCPPRVVKAVQEQVANLIHVPNTWYIESQGLLAKKLSELTGWGGKAFFCNSGTEANEAVIKLARLHGGGKRYKIISCLNSFHGRTMGALSATGQPKYHNGIQPMLPGFSYVPFGDLEAMQNAVDDETCAILVEPIQGEGGINLPPEGYLEGLRQLANDNELLLIFDEVQSGMGRTGTFYASQNWDVQPDALTLAKALGGGIACGGLIARPEIAEKLKPGTHACTFGGNPIACVAALATIETIEQDGLLERAQQLEQKFLQRLSAMKEKCSWIEEIRIRGVMVGIQLSIEGAPLVEACRQRQLLINCTHSTVIRLLPALTLSDAELEQGCDVLEEVLVNYQPQ